jgi:hypothetical protein
MKKNVISRRLVLRGAGGFTLGLPMLPSLLSPKRALGAPAFARPPRFVAITTDHGGIAGPNMYPGAASLTTQTQLFAGHQISSGPLAASRKVEGTTASISPVLRAPAALFTEALLGKMNVLRGLDIPFYIAHHSGGHLGNHARNDGNGTDGQMVQAFPFPTIDQVMAWSPAFYTDLGSIKQRALVSGTRGGISWGYSNPAARSGAIQGLRTEASSLAMFNQIFVPGGTTPPAAARKPIVDRVLESYRQLRNGNARLSAADRQRLDDHLARLAELQRRVTAVSPVALASCSNVRRPVADSSAIGYSYADPVKSKAKFQLINDVIVAGFMCGTTRIGLVGVGDTFEAFGGDWHQDVAHKYATTGEPLLVSGLRNTFEWVFLDLISKLDVEEVPGSTYLDSALVQWTQESGTATHDSASIPVVTAGSASGYFKTGLHVDYRNQTTRGRVVEYGDWHEYSGLTYNRWLATALSAMGVPRAEFERNGVPGYGHPFVSPSYAPTYVNGVLQSASDPVPIIKA